MKKSVHELAKAAHAQSVKSGFWLHDEGCAGDCAQPGFNDRICANLDWLMKMDLVHSELSEALEEYRLTDEKRGGPLGAILYKCGWWDGGSIAAQWTECRYRDDALHKEAGSGCATYADVKKHKPEGFVVELADAAIRIFDFIGRLDAEFGSTIDFSTDDFYNATYEALTGQFIRKPQRFSYQLHRAHLRTAEAGANLTERDYFAVVEGHNRLLDALSYTEQMALAVGGDFDAAIEIKMAYNATRPFKHGGKRV